MSYTLNQPANRWEDAIPSGNGPLGALVFGHVVQDWVVLNHHRCWIEHSRSELPHLAPQLAEIRRLQAEGRWAEAAVFPSALDEVGYRCETDPLGEIWIHHHDITATRDYRSSLDLQSGEVVVAWSMKGRHHERRLFVSRADDVIVLTVEDWAPRELHMACCLRPHRVEDVTDYGSGRRPQPQTPPLTWDARQGSGWHAHIGRYQDGREFGAVLQSVPLGGGSAYNDEYWGGAWTGVQNAESVLVLVKCWWDEPADVAIPRLLEEMTALPADYQTLLQRHLERHEPLMEAFSLDLGADAAERGKANTVLVQEAFEGAWRSRTGGTYGGLPAPPADHIYARRLLDGESSGALEWRLQTGLGQRLPQQHQCADDVLARATDGPRSSARAAGGLLLPVSR